MTTKLCGLCEKTRLRALTRCQSANACESTNKIRRPNKVRKREHHKNPRSPTFVMINDSADFVGKIREVHHNNRPQTANVRPAKRADSEGGTMDSIIAAIATSPVLAGLLGLFVLVAFSSLLYFILLFSGVFRRGNSDDDDIEHIDTIKVSQTRRNGERVAESDETLWSALAMALLLRRDATRLNRSVEIVDVPKPDGINNEVHLHVKDGTGVTALLTVLSGSDEMLANLKQLILRYQD